MPAIIRSWSATPETKTMLEEMRANDKTRRHALVRQCRIKNSIEEVGLPDLRARKNAVLESTQIMSQAFGARGTCGIMLLTRERCIAHQLYVEGIAGNIVEEKEAAAEAK